MSAAHDTPESLRDFAVCTGCRKPFPRFALDTTRRCETCPADDKHGCINKIRIAAALRILPLCIGLVFGRVLLPSDHAAMWERADATRDAWIADIEAEGDADMPAHPHELAWCREGGVLVPEVGT